MMIKRNKEIYWGEFKGASLGDMRQNTFQIIHNIFVLQV